MWNVTGNFWNLGFPIAPIQAVQNPIAHSSPPDFIIKIQFIPTNYLMKFGEGDQKTSLLLLREESLLQTFDKTNTEVTNFSEK